MKSESPVKYMNNNSRFSLESSTGWAFDQDSAYMGSPFESIEGIPGFDEDGLPSQIKSDYV